MNAIKINRERFYAWRLLIFLKRGHDLYLPGKLKREDNSCRKQRLTSIAEEKWTPLLKWLSCYCDQNEFRKILYNKVFKRTWILIRLKGLTEIKQADLWQ